LKVAIDRRDKRRRAGVIRLVVDQIVHNPESRVTIKNLKDFLNIPEDAAVRIIDNLARAGLMYEMSPGVWGRMVKLPSGRGAARLPHDV
jgi:predicted transcriptional regulator